MSTDYFQHIFNTNLLQQSQAQVDKQRPNPNTDQLTPGNPTPTLDNPTTKTSSTTATQATIFIALGVLLDKHTSTDWYSSRLYQFYNVIRKQPNGVTRRVRMTTYLEYECI